MMRPYHTEGSQETVEVHTPMADLTFADAIAVESLGDNRFRSADPRAIDFFLGGKEIAAGAYAAATTVEPALRLLSASTTFVGRREVTGPLFFQVKSLRDGRSFATREVEASQPETGTWFKSVLTFHAVEDGVDRQLSLPTAPPPDELLTADQEASLGDRRPLNAASFPWDADFELRFERVPDVGYRFWARSRLPIGDDPILQDCAVLYLSDLRGGSPGLLVSGWPHQRMNAATLDHTVWLHRSAKVDEWLLVDLNLLSIAGSRSLSMATICTQLGEHVATYVQDTIVRVLNGQNKLL